MSNRMNIVIWIVAFLSSAPNLKAVPSASPGALQSEEASIHLPVTSHNTAVEDESTLALVNVHFLPRTDTSRTVATGPTLPPEPVIEHASFKPHTAPPRANPPTAVPGLFDSPNTESHTAQDTSFSFIPVKSTTLTQGLATTPPSTIASSIPNEEHQTSSARSTVTTSEVLSLEKLSSASQSGLASTLTSLTDTPQTTGLAALENFNQDTPSELDVGDEATGGGPPASPLDLLLTGLVSVFIFSTALLSIMLFLRFRQQSQHPEFHRLQDLPMDDLLEDTPLSRYTY